MSKEWEVQTSVRRVILRAHLFLVESMMSKGRSRKFTNLRTFKTAQIYQYYGRQSQELNTTLLESRV